MTKVNSRKIALQVVVQINEEGAYANLALDKALLAYPDLDRRDKGLITEIVYGSVKYRSRLDYILNQYAQTKVQKMNIWVRNILRTSLYQMLFLDKIPVSAAVDEAVSLAKEKAPKGSDKFVNAVLRNVERNRENLAYPHKGKQPVQYLSVWYSFPQWIIERMVKQYGVKQAEQLCQYFNEPAPLWIRTNTLKINRAELQEKLHDLGLSTQISENNQEGLKFTQGVNLHQLELFQKGYFTVQDESSMLVAGTAAPQPQQRVLDVCSAPGGKTTHMAQLMHNTGEIIACDIHEHRLSLIEENCQRLGITNVKTVLQDGLLLHERFEPETFDVVLVDAPCSGLGVLGRRPDSRWTKRAGDIQELAVIQKGILAEAAVLVKKGGTLVYSTCTITPEENGQQVAAFLSEHPEYSLESEKQYLPFVDKMDGFYIARLKRK